MTKPAILIFACAFGVMFAARNAVGFLTPHMAPDLQLEARHLGLLSAVLAGGWALTGWLLPRFMQARNTHRVLAVLLVLLALDCFATSLASGFAWLLLCRLLCGMAGGPMLPLIQDIVARSTGSERRGFNMGLVQGIGGSLIAAIIAPVALVPIAERFGWRMDFVVLAMLALCIALVLHLQHATPSTAALHQDSAENDVQAAPAHGTRNIVLCSLIGSFMVTWLVLTTTFFPVYLTSIRRVSAVDMGVLMALIGAGSLCGVLLLPYLSDRLGRRLMLGVAALGALSPAALLLNDTSFHVMGAMLFIGSLAGGTFPLFLAVVPSESVPKQKIAASIGVVQIACELVGGVAAPICVGWLAVRHGLQLPVVVTLVAALAASVLAAGLRLERRRPALDTAAANASS